MKSGSLLGVSAAELKALCRKYGGRLPRYTSYPTAVELKPVPDIGGVAARLKAAAAARAPLSLYVHLPHCHAPCFFCACNRIVTRDAGAKQRYLENLSRECELLREEAGTRLPIVELHLGGGSPSYLDERELTFLDEILQRSFEISPEAEKSVELDPRTMDDAKAKLLYAQGFRRASIGVQDFNEHVQRIVNRVQPYELTKSVVDSLRSAGFPALNIDLIYGLPEQHPDTFLQSIDRVLTLAPQRVALYGYAHVAWKAKTQEVLNRHHLPDPEERIALFLSAMDAFLSAGYKYIGLDHFALPGDSLAAARRDGKLRRNFMGYTSISGSGIIAVGLSSISDVDGCLYQNLSELGDYEQAIAARRLPVGKMLVRSLEDKVRAHFIERIMCDNHLDRAALCSAGPHPALAERVFDEGLTALAAFVPDGLVELSDDRMQVTPRGRLFVRSLASVFDTYLAAHQRHAAFSQGV